MTEMSTADAGERLIHATRLTAQEFTRLFQSNRTPLLPPERLKDVFAAEFPETGQDLEEAIRSVLRTIGEYSILPRGTEDFGHMQSRSTLASICGDFFATLINQSLDSWDQSPAATHIEAQVVDWLCRLAGYPVGSGGTFTPGASLSNLTALYLGVEHLLAREGTPDRSVVRVIGSPEDHHSVVRALRVLGIDEKHLISISESSADPVAEIADRINDSAPTIVVITAGTTSRGHCGSLRALESLNRARVWVHVDAAHAGACLFSDSARSLLAGIERADSIALDGHKLLFQPIGCGVLLLRNALTTRCLERSTAYFRLWSQWDLVSQSLLTTRRFDALKLYFSLLVEGRSNIAGRIECTLEAARMVAETIAADPAFELLEMPQLNIVCFRLRAAEGADEHQSIAQILITQRITGVSLARIGDRDWFRVVINDPAITGESAQSTLDRIVQCANDLHQKGVQ